MNSIKGAGKDPETSQMTIFYAGKVIVFNDLLVERAKEVMMMASKASFPGAVMPSSEDLPPAKKLLQPPTEPVPWGNLFFFFFVVRIIIYSLQLGTNGFICMCRSADCEEGISPSLFGEEKR